MPRPLGVVPVRVKRTLPRPLGVVLARAKCTSSRPMGVVPAQMKCTSPQPLDVVPVRVKRILPRPLGIIHAARLNSTLSPPLAVATLSQSETTLAVSSPQPSSVLCRMPSPILKNTLLLPPVRRIIANTTSSSSNCSRISNITGMSAQASLKLANHKALLRNKAAKASRSRLNAAKERRRAEV